MSSGHPNMQDVAGDVASALAVLGALAGYLPAVATLAAIVWYAIQIYDWVERRGARRGKLLEVAERLKHEADTDAD